MTPATLHALHIVLNAVDFFAWFSACGMIMARAGLVPAAAFELSVAGKAWRRGMLAWLAILITTGIALLIVRTAEMSGLPLSQAMGILPEVLLHSHFGVVWAIHLILLALLAGAIFLPPGVATPPSACLAVMLALTYSAASHASDRGDFTLSELNDWAHVIATSLWGGGIMATLFFGFPLLRDRRALLTRSVFRLSRISAWALAGVLLTGVYNAVLQIPGFADVSGTAYGRTLAVKVALVSVMALLGAYSRFIVIPALRRAPDNGNADRQIGRVRFCLRTDVALLAAVLIAASMLIQGMPPSSAPGMTQGMQGMHAGGTM